MQLGARGVLDLMNSMGGLQSASKFWSPGDRVAYIFRVTEEDDMGNVTIPVSFRYGHNVDLGDDFKRSFIPTTSVMNPATNQVIEPDFAYQSAGLFRAILDGAKQREIEIAKDNAPSEAAFKVDLGQIEENYKKKYPAVGGLNVRAYTEVAVVKLDVNGRIIGDEIKFEYGSLQLSKKKLGQLIQATTVPNAYKKDSGFFYITMQTATGDKKQAGQVDWNPVTDDSKKLENIYPDFQAKVNALFEQRNPTEETIGAKVFDFRPYDLDAFKTASANYIEGRRHYFMERNSDKYRDNMLKKHNVDALRNIGLVADADKIKAIMGSDEEKPKETVEEEANNAQSIDLAALSNS